MRFAWTTILAPQEQLLKEFSISSTYQKAILVVTVLVSIASFFITWYVGIALLVLGCIYWYYIKNSKHYAFTDKRIILVESFMGTSIISIDYNQITDIEIEQSFFDQFGGWGTLIINTAGTNAPEIQLPFIDNPQAMKQNLDQIRDNIQQTVVISPNSPVTPPPQI